MGMSAFYGGFDNEEAQAEAHRVFDKVAEMEGVMLDTSDIYGPKTNEELIGWAASWQIWDDRDCDRQGHCREKRQVRHCYQVWNHHGRHAWIGLVCGVH